MTRDGRGWSRCSSCPTFARPAVFSTFLMWLLADLFHELPEVGDIDKPSWCSSSTRPSALRRCIQGLPGRDRADRAADPIKGVGIFFVTQTPKDVPDECWPARLAGAAPVAAHTPNDAKALKQTVATFPSRTTTWRGCSSWDRRGIVT